MRSESPTLPEFEHEIGSCMARGDLAGAATVAAQCRAAWPTHPAGWLLGSIVALLAEDKPAALALIDERLTRDPRNVQCLLQKAECLLALGERAAAFAAADAAADAAPDIPAVLDAIAEFLIHAGEHERALKLYDRAAAAAPREPAVRAKRAIVHRFLGNFELAAADYEAVLKVKPAAPKILKGLAELRRQSHERNSIPAMQAALAAAPDGSTDAAILHFGLAKSYADLGDHAACWRHLTAANRNERARIDYDPALDRTVFEQIIGGFPAVEPIAGDASGERPIFIVGVPRTGTTLVERIVSGHSQVHPGGEMTALPEAIMIIAERGADPDSPGWRGYAALLAELDPRAVAHEYLARARRSRGDRPRFTDKQLMNFLYCGLILRAFPHAGIVHVTRHPLAACHAIYRTRFNGSYPFAYDLAELADFYVCYRRLMAHWHAVLPGRILDLRYEELVTAFEPTTRRLLEYLGLPFEPACLDFQHNPAPVITTSSVQVRQPLYDSSLDSWRHFAAELAPVRERLEAAGIAIA
jgi:tetratricopeptide (TPR) repeat protein